MQGRARSNDASFVWLCNINLKKGRKETSLRDAQECGQQEEGLRVVVHRQQGSNQVQDALARRAAAFLFALEPRPPPELRPGRRTDTLSLRSVSTSDLGCLAEWCKPRRTGRLSQWCLLSFLWMARPVCAPTESRNRPKTLLDAEAERRPRLCTRRPGESAAWDQTRTTTFCRICSHRCRCRKTEWEGGIVEETEEESAAECRTLRQQQTLSLPKEGGLPQSICSSGRRQSARCLRIRQCHWWTASCASAAERRWRPGCWTKAGWNAKTYECTLNGRKRDWTGRNGSRRATGGQGREDRRAQGMPRPDGSRRSGRDWDTFQSSSQDSACWWCTRGREAGRAWLLP